MSVGCLTKSLCLLITFHCIKTAQSNQRAAIGIGKQCNNHNECGDQMVCSRNRCEVGQPSGKTCVSAQNCERGDACKHGICWKLGEIPCKDSRNCPQGMSCVRGLCKYKREEVDSEICPRGRPFYKGGRPLECDDYSRRKTCPRGFYCDRKTRYCCEEDRGNSYNDDDDDDEYENGQLELNDRCRRNDRCRPKNSDCINGRCVCLSGFYEEDGECVSRRGSKRRRQGLGKDCSDNSDCYTPYSECNSGRCACRNGFQTEAETCIPNAHNCPISTHVIVNSQVRQCVIELGPNNKRKDNCPYGNFCVSYGSPSVETKKSLAGLVSGFCCPKIMSVCPVGQPKTCTGGDCQRHCPRDTHFCHRNGDYKWEEVCCEKPCRDGHVFDRDRCVPEKEYYRRMLN